MYDNNSVFPFFSFVDFNDEEERSANQIFAGSNHTVPDEGNFMFEKKIEVEDFLKFATPKNSADDLTCRKPSSKTVILPNPSFKASNTTQSSNSFDSLLNSPRSSKDSDNEF